jgi:CheY-like chemotaxis protein
MLEILLLDDNADLAIMLQQILEWRGHRVKFGQGGQIGLELLSKAETLPDVIICDLLMPDLDGYGVLTQVRENPDWAKIPFIIMSANVSVKDRHEALNRGANDYLVKPFSVKDLDRVLEKLGKAQS